MGFFKRLFGKPAQTKKVAGQISAGAIPSQFYADIQQAQAGEQRYTRLGDPSGLDEAVAAWLRIIKHQDFNIAPKRFQLAALNDSGGLFLQRYWALGQLADLNQALTLWEQAVKRTSPDFPARHNYLNNLAIGLRTRYVRDGKVADLDAAIEAWQTAVEHTPTDSPDSPAYLNNLSNGLLDRFAYSGNWDDLEAGIAASKMAVEHTPSDSPDLPNRLNNLGIGLRHRYTHSNNLADLESAIKAYQSAVAKTSPDSPALPSKLINLGNSLFIYYGHTGKLTDLEAAIDVIQTAIHRTHKDSPHLPAQLTSLGNALRQRYAYSGKGSDLKAAIDAYRDAVQRTSKESPSLPMYLSNLGNGLSNRYARTGQLVDLETSIDISYIAVEQTPLNSPELPGRLANLGSGLITRYGRTEQLADLEDAIDAYRRAIELTPLDSTNLSLHHHNLSLALRNRFTLTGEMADLKNAIDLGRKAVQHTLLESPSLPMYLNTLGAALYTHYLHTGQLANLVAAIDAYQSAVKYTAPDSPGLAIRLNNLGSALRDRYAHSSQLVHLEGAVKVYRQAVNSSTKISSEAGFRAARNWLSWSFERNVWTEVIEAFEGVRYLYEMRLGMQFQREDKAYTLGETHGLAAMAAYAHWQLGQPEEAASALEANRAQLLREAQERQRRDIEQLPALGYEELYQQYTTAVQEYTNLLALSENPPADWHERINAAYAAYQAAAADIRQTVGAVHPQYRFFLQALPFNEIQKQARQAPLVYLADTDEGGLALIVTSEQVVSVSLPNLTSEALREQVQGSGDEAGQSGYLGAYRTWRKDINNPNKLEAWKQALDETTQWLWPHVMESLLAALAPLHPQDSQVTLIPSGWLAMLPLHAAWTNDETQPGKRRYALDAYTFTYAPSAQALSHARPQADAIAPDRLLVVENPDASLRLSRPAAEAALSHFAPDQRRHLSQTAVTFNAVQQAIPQHNALYFFTHGIANFDAPLESGVVLADDQLLTLRDIFNLRSDQTRLAILSACETGVPANLELLDEVVSLPSGLMQAGIPGVVGSLWTVREDSTAILMTIFFDQWRAAGLFAPAALRQAQRTLRDARYPGAARRYIENDILEGATTVSSAEVSDAFYRDLLLIDFDHPFYWAAFTYTGI